ncbi:MAG: quinol oxidase [Candidatus Tectimicrobiota bacterium]|nr:MAG: quinol oxidase [Candidatus Tectomicrobia bacterium]
MWPFPLRPLAGWGLTVLRVIVGVVFFLHGWQKLFSWGLGSVAGFMSQSGIPLPGLAAVVVTAAELLGGLALILGLLTRWAALVLAVNMLVAILVVHLRHGFFLPNGFEFALSLLAANVALLLEGGGKLELEAQLRPRQAPQAAPAQV